MTYTLGTIQLAALIVVPFVCGIFLGFKLSLRGPPPEEVLARKDAEWGARMQVLEKERDSVVAARDKAVAALAHGRGQFEKLHGAYIQYRNAYKAAASALAEEQRRKRTRQNLAEGRPRRGRPPRHPSPMEAASREAATTPPTLPTPDKAGISPSPTHSES